MLETKVKIAINVTRTRITVLVMNLTIIALMLSILHGIGSRDFAVHMVSTISLLISFCLTIVALFLFLHSQSWDEKGLSLTMPYVLGSITTYIALSKTVTAFFYEFLLTFISKDSLSNLFVKDTQHSIYLEQLGDLAMLIIVFMCSAVWAILTYLGPILIIFNRGINKKQQKIAVAFYFTLLLPIYWVDTKIEHISNYDSINTIKLFALQFIQPVLWFN